MKTLNRIPILLLLFFTFNSTFATTTPPKELYELRRYEIRTGGNQNALIEYIQNVLSPTLQDKGVRTTALFRELGNSEPTAIWMLIAYPSTEVYLASQELHKDSTYTSKASKYNAIEEGQYIYNRIESMLLLAFDGITQMEAIKDNSSLFELRMYEGYSEDATKRKIDMFNKEELDLFYEVGLHPVFFGEQIIGPYRPCLTYMIQFKDMEEHDANWKKFIDSEKWNTMVVKDEYAHTVSKIHKIFLTPIK